MYKKMIIDDVSEIADQIMKLSREKSIDNVAIVGYYETICGLFNTLIKSTDSMFVSGELRPYEYDGYEDAYSLEYDNNEIWLSKMCYQDDEYLTVCGDIVFVEEDFYDKYVKSFGKINVIEFGFSDVNKKVNESKDDVNICMDDDECGFCFCMVDDKNHIKFKYRDNKKLTQEQVDTIINEYLG